MNLGWGRHSWVWGQKEGGVWASGKEASASRPQSGTPATGWRARPRSGAKVTPDREAVPTPEGPPAHHPGSTGAVLDIWEFPSLIPYFFFYIHDFMINSDIISISLIGIKYQILYQYENKYLGVKMQFLDEFLKFIYEILKWPFCTICHLQSSPPSSTCIAVKGFSLWKVLV